MCLTGIHSYLLVVSRVPFPRLVPVGVQAPLAAACPPPLNNRGAGSGRSQAPGRARVEGGLGAGLGSLMSAVAVPD